MNKFLLLLGVILVLSYGSGTTLYLDEEVTLDVAKGLSLREAESVKVNRFTCQMDPKFFDFTIVELQKWVNIIEKKSSLVRDVQVIKTVIKLVYSIKTSIQSIHTTSYIELDDQAQSVAMETALTELDSEWAKCNVDELLSHVRKLQSNLDVQQKLQIADLIIEKLQTIETQINVYITESQTRFSAQELKVKVSQIQEIKKKCFSGSVKQAATSGKQIKPTDQNIAAQNKGQQDSNQQVGRKGRRQAKADGQQISNTQAQDQDATLSRKQRKQQKKQQADQLTQQNLQDPQQQSRRKRGQPQDEQQVPNQDNQQKRRKRGQVDSPSNQQTNPDQQNYQLGKRKRQPKGLNTEGDAPGSENQLLKQPTTYPLDGKSSKKSLRRNKAKNSKKIWPGAEGGEEEDYGIRQLFGEPTDSIDNQSGESKKLKRASKKIKASKVRKSKKVWPGPEGGEEEDQGIQQPNDASNVKPRKQRKIKKSLKKAKVPKVKKAKKIWPGQEGGEEEDYGLGQLFGEPADINITPNDQTNQLNQPGSPFDSPKYQNPTVGPYGTVSNKKGTTSIREQIRQKQADAIKQFKPKPTYQTKQTNDPTSVNTYEESHQQTTTVSQARKDYEVQKNLKSKYQSATTGQHGHANRVTWPYRDGKRLPIYDSKSKKERQLGVKPETYQETLRIQSRKSEKYPYQDNYGSKQGYASTSGSSQKGTYVPGGGLNINRGAGQRTDSGKINEPSKYGIGTNKPIAIRRDNRVGSPIAVYPNPNVLDKPIKKWAKTQQEIADQNKKDIGHSIYSKVPDAEKYIPPKRQITPRKQKVIGPYQRPIMPGQPGVKSIPRASQVKKTPSNATPQEPQQQVSVPQKVISQSKSISNVIKRTQDQEQKQIDYKQKQAEQRQDTSTTSTSSTSSTTSATSSTSRKSTNSNTTSRSRKPEPRPDQIKYPPQNPTRRRVQKYSPWIKHRQPGQELPVTRIPTAPGQGVPQNRVVPKSGQQGQNRPRSAQQQPIPQNVEKERSLRLKRRDAIVPGSDTNRIQDVNVTGKRQRIPQVPRAPANTNQPIIPGSQKIRPTIERPTVDIKQKKPKVPKTEEPVVCEGPVTQQQDPVECPEPPKVVDEPPKKQKIVKPQPKIKDPKPKKQIPEKEPTPQPEQKRRKRLPINNETKTRPFGPDADHKNDLAEPEECDDLQEPEPLPKPVTKTDQKDDRSVTVQKQPKAPKPGSKDDFELGKKSRKQIEPEQKKRSKDDAEVGRKSIPIDDDLKRKEKVPKQDIKQDSEQIRKPKPGSKDDIDVGRRPKVVTDDQKKRSKDDSDIGKTVPKQIESGDSTKKRQRVPITDSDDQPKVAVDEKKQKQGSKDDIDVGRKQRVVTDDQKKRSKDDSDIGKTVPKQIESGDSSKKRQRVPITDSDDQPKVAVDEKKQKQGSKDDIDVGKRPKTVQDNQKRSKDDSDVGKNVLPVDGKRKKGADVKKDDNQEITIDEIHTVNPVDTGPQEIEGAAPNSVEGDTKSKRETRKVTDAKKDTKIDQKFEIKKQTGKKTEQITGTVGGKTQTKSTDEQQSKEEVVEKVVLKKEPKKLESTKKQSEQNDSKEETSVKKDTRKDQQITKAIDQTDESKGKRAEKQIDSREKQNLKKESTKTEERTKKTTDQINESKKQDVRTKKEVKTDEQSKTTTKTDEESKTTSKTTDGKKDVKKDVKTDEQSKTTTKTDEESKTTTKTTGGKKDVKKDVKTDEQSKTTTKTDEESKTTSKTTDGKKDVKKDVKTDEQSKTTTKTDEESKTTSKTTGGKKDVKKDVKTDEQSKTTTKTDEESKTTSKTTDGKKDVKKDVKTDEQSKTTTKTDEESKTTSKTTGGKKDVKKDVKTDEQSKTTTKTDEESKTTSKTTDGKKDVKKDVKTDEQSKTTTKTDEESKTTSKTTDGKKDVKKDVKTDEQSKTTTKTDEESKTTSKTTDGKKDVKKDVKTDEQSKTTTKTDEESKTTSKTTDGKKDVKKDVKTDEQSKTTTKTDEESKTTSKTTDGKKDVKKDVKTDEQSKTTTKTDEESKTTSKTTDGKKDVKKDVKTDEQSKTTTKTDEESKTTSKTTDGKKDVKKDVKTDEQSKTTTKTDEESKTTSKTTDGKKDVKKDVKTDEQSKTTTKTDEQTKSTTKRTDIKKEVKTDEQNKTTNKSTDIKKAKEEAEEGEESKTTSKTSDVKKKGKEEVSVKKSEEETKTTSKTSDVKKTKQDGQVKKQTGEESKTTSKTTDVKKQGKEEVLVKKSEEEEESKTSDVKKETTQETKVKKQTKETEVTKKTVDTKIDIKKQAEVKKQEKATEVEEDDNHDDESELDVEIDSESEVSDGKGGYKKVLVKKVRRVPVGKVKKSGNTFEVEYEVEDNVSDGEGGFRKQLVKRTKKVSKGKVTKKSQSKVTKEGGKEYLTTTSGQKVEIVREYQNTQATKTQEEGEYGRGNIKTKQEGDDDDVDENNFDVEVEEEISVSDGKGGYRKEIVKKTRRVNKSQIKTSTKGGKDEVEIQYEVEEDIPDGKGGFKKQWVKKTKRVSTGKLKKAKKSRISKEGGKEVLTTKSGKKVEIVREDDGSVERHSTDDFSQGWYEYQFEEEGDVKDGKGGLKKGIIKKSIKIASNNVKPTKEQSDDVIIEYDDDDQIVTASGEYKFKLVRKTKRVKKSLLKFVASTGQSSKSSTASKTGGKKTEIVREDPGYMKQTISSKNKQREKFESGSSGSSKSSTKSSASSKSSSGKSKSSRASKVDEDGEEIFEEIEYYEEIEVYDDGKGNTKQVKGKILKAVDHDMENETDAKTQVPENKGQTKQEPEKQVQAEAKTIQAPVQAPLPTQAPAQAPAVQAAQAPATQAPATQAPATQAPATQAPATQAPATQAPAPATQAPATQAPATQAPATQAPATQAPATQAPAPATQAPAAQAPATQAPATQAPAAQAPATQAPATQAPATQAPAAQAPATQAPATQAPAPATKAPATQAPAKQDHEDIAAVKVAPKEVKKDDAKQDSVKKAEIPIPAALTKEAPKQPDTQKDTKATHDRSAHVTDNNEEVNPNEPTEYQQPKHKASERPKEKIIQQVTTKYVNSAFDGPPAASYEFDGHQLQDAEEYGYGFWIKHSQTIPKAYKPQVETYHFISRLTSNKEHEDFIKYGDRTLAIFLLDNIFVFATYDFSKKEKNLANNLVILNEDIESMWYFISYSYSSHERKVVGFLASYGQGNKVFRVEVPATHVPPFYLKLIIGGKHLHYPGINGQFANIYYDIDAPAFIDTEEQMRRIIKELSNEPQSVQQLIEQDVLRQSKEFRANVESDKITLDPQESQLVLEEYAIAGWFRWIDDLKVEEANTFQILNLRSTQEKSPGKGALGDRALEVHYTYGGGAKSSVYLNTYSVEGNKAKGNPYISKAVVDDKFIWTYVYFGYITDGTKAYGAVIRPGQADEVKFDGLQHKLVTILHFTIGGDKQVSAFNGKIGYVGVYIGPGSYRSGLNFGNKFSYGDGAAGLYQVGKPILYKDDAAEPNVVRESQFDAENRIVDKILIHDDEKIKINGQSEYSLGLWTRWLRTSPKYLAKRANLHNIAKLGTQPYVLENVDGKLKRANEQRAQKPKDSTLVVTLGEEAYEFYTYDNDQVKKEDIKFGDKLEGFWNYVYFGYKRFGNKGQAKGYIQFGNEGDVKEATFEVLHDFILDYVEFTVGKSSAPLFNGQLTKIQFQVGPGAFIPTLEALKVNTQGTLPEKAQIHPVPRQTLQLLGAPVQFPKQGDDGIVFQFDKYSGAKEYSVSGWVKWSGIQQYGKVTNVIAFAQKRIADLDGKNEQTLAIFRSDKSFTFNTYGCKGSDCSPIISKEQEFGEYWDQWTYIYFGYSQSLRKTFGYLKYTFSDAKFNQDQVDHFYVSTFTVIVGKEKNLLESWQGFMKTWVVNIGDGAFREGGFDEDENVKVHFGFTSGTDHIKLQQAGQEAHREEKVVECAAGQKDVPLQIEFEQSDRVHLQGVFEYGYGYWAKFEYLAATPLYQKPQWLGLSRLTINKEFNDFSAPGDRVLLVLMGNQVYHFSTYSVVAPANNNINGNIPYKTESEGEWTYIYFSYKRVSQTAGLAVAFTSFGEITAGIQMDALHIPLANYIQLLIGSAGKYYPSFNGKISTIRFNLGSGSFIVNKAGILARIKNKDPQPESPVIPPKLETILEGKHDCSNDLKVENPFKYNNEAREYGVQIWFRWFKPAEKQNQLLYRLTTTPVEKLSNSNVIGDRTLVLSHHEAVQFSTYTLQDKDQYIVDVPYQCNIPTQLQEVWTFTYFAYNKQAGKVQYYLLADKFECKGNEKIQHAVGSNFWIYFLDDKQLTKFDSRVASIIVNFGSGSYRHENFQNLPGLLAASKLFSKESKYSWEKSEKVTLSIEGETKTFSQEFVDSQDIPIESATEYSIGFWTRFLSDYPGLPKTGLPNVMQIARLSANQKLHPGKVTLGDRILSTYLAFENYQFATYDLNTDTPNDVLNVKYGSLEGQWKYLYMGYNREKQLVISYAYDGDKNILSSRKADILHKPLGEYIKIIFGAEEGIAPFQGQLGKISLHIGKGSFLELAEDLKKAVDTSYALPPELTVAAIHKQKHGTQELIGESDGGQTTGNELSGDTWAGVGEYSISGWFKISDIPVVKEQGDSPCELLFRIANNKKEQLNDKKSQGDRALFGEICSQETVKLSTYTLTGLKDWNEAKFLEEKQDLGEFRKAWTFVYMGYSEVLNEIHAIFHLFQGDHPIIFKSIHHFVPHYMAVFVGKDAFSKKFNGQMQKWVARYGQNAFTSVSKRGYEDQLPFFNTIQTNQKYIWNTEKDEILDLDKPQEHIFTHETESVDEYSFGVWTRWLYGYPTILTERSDLHTIFRLSQTREYADKTELGNRVLSAFVAQGSYLFSTYDAAKPIPAIDAKVPYTSLEGQWHYIYCGYKDKEFFGLVLFKETQKVEHIKLDVHHHVLTGFAKLVLGAKEFGYAPFHGWLYDPRAFFGAGSFQNEGQKVVDMVLKLHRKLPVPPVTANDWKWDVPLVDSTNKDDLLKNKDHLSFTFKDRSQIQEYSFGLWIQSAVLLPEMKDEPRAVIRLTTNDGSIQGDEKYMGDRTLFALATTQTIVLSSYDVKDPKFETVNFEYKVPQYQWQFLYFGYSDSVTKGYVLTPTGPQEKKQKIQHIVPNNFYLILIKDQNHPQFFGKVQGVKLLFGKGSLVENPQELIDTWPYDPKTIPKPPQEEQKELNIQSAKIDQTKKPEHKQFKED